MRSLSLAILLLAAVGLAQQAPVRFEAATIKPADANAQGSMVGLQSPAAFEATNASALDLVASAFELRDFQVIGAPAWASESRFDIVGTTGIPPASHDSMAQAYGTMRLMLQSLLTDRFGMLSHRETRQLPIFNLVVAKGGLKLPASHCVPAESRTPTTNNRTICGNSGTSGGAAVRTFTASGVTMDRLVTVLSRLVGRTVVDRTGYTATFDATFEFSPDPGAGGDASGAGSAPAGTTAPLLVTALQESLGLKLEPSEGPVEVLVVDHLDKPSGN